MTGIPTWRKRLRVRAGLCVQIGALFSRPFATSEMLLLLMGSQLVPIGSKILLMRFMPACSECELALLQFLATDLLCDSRTSRPLNVVKDSR
jgi:hypothetical protein